MEFKNSELMKFLTSIILALITFLSWGQPAPRSLANITFDEKRGQLIVYGGSTDEGLSSDLWVLKGMNWTKLSDTGPKCFAPAFGYDPDRDRVILFAGFGDGRQLNDTWEWDDKKWNQIAIEGPPARLHAMGIYDQSHKYFLMFGGFGSNGSLSDTWAYDGKSWRQLDNDGPKECLPHGLVYDEVKNKVILITYPNKPDPVDNRKKNEMWEWTGMKWNKLAAQAPATTQRSLAALAGFGKDGIVLFDGDDLSGNVGKTWTFSNGQWTSATLPGPSAPRIAHGMVFDKTRGMTLLFGGTDRNWNFNDLWAWDGKKWNDLTEQRLKVHPDDESALRTYASSLYHNGDLAKAEDIYKRLYAKDPRNTKTLIDLGILMYRLERPGDAAKYITSATDLAKTDYLKLGKSLNLLKKYTESAAYYEEAIKVDPQGREYYNLGCVYALNGNKDKAFSNLDKAIENGFGYKRQFENDGDLASLRSDARWTEIVRRLK